jgi:hypothetical protein
MTTFRDFTLFMDRSTDHDKIHLKLIGVFDGINWECTRTPTTWEQAEAMILEFLKDYIVVPWEARAGRKGMLTLVTKV